MATNLLMCSSMTNRRAGIYNILSKKEHRKELRHSSTAVEAILWKYLQGRKLAGKKFRRQASIGPYIVDFYCPECRVIVELDGAPHFTERGAERDARRTEYLNECGIRVIRFENKMIYRDLTLVLEEIERNLTLVT